MQGTALGVALGGDLLRQRCLGGDRLASRRWVRLGALLGTLVTAFWQDLGHLLGAAM